MRIRLSTKEQEELVLKNRKIVYAIVNQLSVAPDDYEDIVSIGMIGLIKSAITFDSSKNILFSTYAGKCIKNEIFMYYAKASKYANDISINEPILLNNGTDDTITLESVIADSKSNFVKEIINREDLIQIISIILNYLKGKERIAMLYFIGNEIQEDIGKKLHVSQRYVSQLQHEAIRKIRIVMNKKVNYKEVFSITIVEDTYRISFLSKDISSFNKIFAKLLKKLKSAEDLPDFKITSNRGRVIIEVPADLDSFSFIAQIIQEMDNWNMTHVANKT